MKLKDFKLKDFILGLPKLIKSKKEYLAMVLCPIFTFYLLEFCTHNPFETMSFEVQLLNIALLELIMVFLYFIIGRLRAALITETVFFMIAGIANYFILQFRSSPIMPWDILSIKTAANVAGNYNYSLGVNTIIVIICFIILIVLEFLFAKHNLSKGWKKKVIGIVVTFALLVGFRWMLKQDAVIKGFDLYIKLFTPTSVQQIDGTAVAFLYETQFMSVSKPSGYNQEEAIKKIESYETDKEVTKTPNVIVIMDETFSDLTALGDFKTNKPVMPFVDSLLAGADNTISGHINVSVLGGNTPNSEFEFLTGNSMAFLPEGSIPYQQYITKQIPSLVSYFNDLGYTTIGMHPYNSTGWNRDTIYPLLGFDQKYFLEDFKNAKYIRKYISDETCFNKIINFYENKKKDEPLFIWNVTMQNHSSFGQKFDNFNPQIQAEGSSSFCLTTYLSVLNRTDSAFKNLIDYFSKVDEDTVIVFYGDHQPNDTVADGVWDLLGVDKNNLTTEQERSRYITPFVIWANYDIDSQSDIKEQSGLVSSINYLGSKLLKTAGLPLPAYFNYLTEVEKDYPVVSGIQVQDSDRNSYTVKEQLDNLNDYAKLQYYRLFGVQK